MKALSPLKEVTRKIGSGATPRGGNASYKDSGISLIRSLNVYDFTFEYSNLAFIDEDQAEQLANVEVQPDDVLLNITGASVARCCIVPKNVLPARVNQHVSIVRLDKTKAHPYFVMYAINSPKIKEHLLSIAQGGATREALTKEKIENFQIPLPDIYLQDKIASILSAYDDLIENNTRRIKILEEMAQSIYRHWFVDFKFPGHKKAKTADSSLGKIPEGWEVVKVGDAASVYRGRSYKSENLTIKGTPFLNLKCINRDGGFRYDGIKYYIGEFKESQTAVAGDIIMAVTDMTQERRIVAHAARVPKMDEALAVLSMDLVKIVPDKGIDKCYMYGMFRYSGFADFVKQYATGVNVLHLSHDCIKNFEFALAPYKIRTDYGYIALPLFEECDLLQLKNQNLRRMRDLLLPKLISGEVDVSKLEIESLS